MNVLAGFLFTSSAVWHGINAYYFTLKAVPFIKTYRLTDERSEILAADVLSWHGGLHGVLAAFALYSTARLFTASKLDIQVPLLLGAAALSQVVLVQPEDRWRPELKWLTIINSALSLGHTLMSIYIYRKAPINPLVGVINGVQSLINK
jgi:hypothetical protein